VETSVNWKKVNGPFQVLCFPKGYHHRKINKVTIVISLKRKYSSEIMDDIFVAPSFKHAAIHFLSEPFLTNDDYSGLGKEGLVIDATVATSISLNFSI